jgi:hypothetical protein
MEKPIFPPQVDGMTVEACFKVYLFSSCAFNVWSVMYIATMLPCFQKVRQVIRLVPFSADLA